MYILRAYLCRSFLLAYVVAASAASVHACLNLSVSKCEYVFGSIVMRSGNCSSVSGTRVV